MQVRKTASSPRLARRVADQRFKQPQFPVFPPAFREPEKDSANGNCIARISDYVKEIRGSSIDSCYKEQRRNCPAWRAIRAEDPNASEFRSEYGGIS
jgi:hypothetical protein